VKQEKAPIRKKYSKPGLRSIPLAAEEVLAVGCKSSQGGFNVGSTPCMQNQCSKNGS
jgi:hypothetical protein